MMPPKRFTRPRALRTATPPLGVHARRPCRTRSRAESAGRGRRAPARPGTGPSQKVQYCGVIAESDVLQQLEDDGADDAAVQPAGAADRPASASRRRSDGTRTRRARRSPWSARAARRPRRRSRPPTCRPRPAARRTGMPIAIARSRLSRIALQRRTRTANARAAARTKNSTSSTVSEYQAAVRPDRSNSKRPSSGPMTTPCRPSEPPVSQSSLLASSSRIRATPSVTISRVRSLPRWMVTETSRAPAPSPPRPPPARPTSGSGITCLANSAAGVRAHAEEGRVAERHDAGVAQHQVERNREQRHDRDLIDDQRVAGQQHRRRESRAATAAAPTAASGGCAQQRLLRAGCAASRLAAPRTNRPCGRQTRITIIRL